VKTDCFVIVLQAPRNRGLFLAWDMEADEAMIFTSADDAKEEALTLEGWKEFAVAPARLDGDEIMVDYTKLVWQTFPSKATKQHSR
jgi:hypothetical protein